MAADNSYYNGRKLDHIDPNDVVTEHREALYLGLTKAQLKERFYLDHVHENMSDGVVGFIGACEVGSANYELHNTSRLGMILFLAESVPGNSDWRQYKAYMDGGINTKGKAVILQVKTTHVNHIRVDATFKSSYLETSTEFGFEYKTLSGSWQRVNLTTGPIPPDVLLNFNNVVNTSLDDAQSLSIRPYIINPEGFYPGAIVAFGATEPISNIDAMKRASACDSTGEENIEMWMTNSNIQALEDIPAISTNTGIYGYLDDEFSIPVPNGFYWGLVPGKSLWVVNGQFIMATECTVTPTVDFDLAIEMDDNGAYIVNVMLTAAKTVNVTVNGSIRSFNSSDQEIAGGSGNGSFSITVIAGEQGAVQATTYVAAPGAAYIKGVVTSTNPTGLTYNSYPG